MFVIHYYINKQILDSYLHTKSEKIWLQGSHYFEIRGRSDFSFMCWQKRSEKQQEEVVTVQGDVKIFL